MDPCLSGTSHSIPVSETATRRSSVATQSPLVKVVCLILVWGVGLVPWARGEEASRREVTDLWEEASLVSIMATELAEQNQRIEADALFRSAETLYRRISREYPGFQPGIVASKLEDLQTHLSRLGTTPDAEKSNTPTLVVDPDKLSSRPGFHKDLFMDGGVSLASRIDLPAADHLGLAYEFYAGENPEDQRRILAGDEHDHNGTLLYPDGAPRFRMIYVNGGQATKHGLSLGEPALERYRQHNREGGAYCGTCAGAFFACFNTNDNPGPREGYLHIFPFKTKSTGISNQPVSQMIPTASPLMKYRGFGEDQLVHEVYHNGGNWIPLEATRGMPGVEVLATYSIPGHPIDGGAAIWSYRKSVDHGRVVSVGSHPEGETSGEIRDLLEACFLYTLDGVGKARSKGRLVPGETRHMNRSTLDEDPLHAKIGDGQVHYFEILVPEETPNMRLELRGTSGFDLHLYLNPGEMDLSLPTEIAIREAGSVKTFDGPMKPGKWMVAVECANRVKTEIRETPDSTYFEVVSHRELLNGIDYEVSLDFR